MGSLLEYNKILTENLSFKLAHGYLKFNNQDSLAVSSKADSLDIANKHQNFAYKCEAPLR